MGYTHYWSFDTEHPEWQPGFARLVLDTRRIIQAARIPLAREFDDPDVPPELAEGWIRFNGVGADGCETFLLTTNPAAIASEWELAEHRRRDFWWSFCKTARRPYDLVVCAVLLRAVHHLPSCFAIGSDGFWDDEWQLGASLRGRGARRLVAELFGADQVPAADPLGAASDGPPSVQAAPARRRRP